MAWREARVSVAADTRSRLDYEKKIVFKFSCAKESGPPGRGKDSGRALCLRKKPRASLWLVPPAGPRPQSRKLGFLALRPLPLRLKVRTVRKLLMEG